jgi:hypothetical protein
LRHHEPSGNGNSVRDVQIDQETLEEIWKLIEVRRKAAESSLDRNGG